MRRSLLPASLHGNVFYSRDRLGRQALPARGEACELEVAQIEVALLLALPLRGHELQVHAAGPEVVLEQQVELALLVLEEAVLLVANEARDGSEAPA